MNNPACRWPVNCCKLRTSSAGTCAHQITDRPFLLALASRAWMTLMTASTRFGILDIGLREALIDVGHLLAVRSLPRRTLISSSVSLRAHSMVVAMRPC